MAFQTQTVDLGDFDVERFLAQQRLALQAPKAKKKKDFLLNQVSTGGGIGGALAGGALGAAAGSAVPVVGTAIGGIIGALLGGAAGSAGGEIVENKVTGDQWDKNVANEALLGGLTSLPVGAGLKLAQAGLKAGTGLGRASAKEFVNEAGVKTLGKRTVAKGSSLGREFDPQAMAAIQRLQGGAPGAVAPTGRIATMGTDLQRSAANTSKVADSYTGEVGILDALNRHGLTGSAANMYRKVDGKLGELSDQIGAHLSTVKNTVPRTDAIKSLQSRAADLLPDDPAYGREIQRSLERLSKSGSGDVSATELFNFKKTLGNRLSPAFKKLNKGADLTVKEQAEMELWRSLDDDITKLAPEVKNLTMDQSRLIAARPGLQAGSLKTAGVPILGIKSQGLEQALQAGRNTAGRAMAGATTAPKAARGVGQGIVGLTVRQGGSRALMGSGEPVDPQTLAPLTDGSQYTDPSALGGAMEQEPSVGGYTKSQIEAAMVRAASDPNGADAFDQLKVLYSMLPEPAANKALPVEAAKAINNATTGMQSLDDLEGMIQSDPSVVSKAAAPDLAPLNSLLGTSSYRAAIKNVQDAMSRLRSGASMTEQEAARFDAMLPRFGDDPKTIAYKTAQFREYFRNTIANAEAGRGTVGIADTLGSSY